MRVERPKDMECFGDIRFGALQKVFELDSGLDNGEPQEFNALIDTSPYVRQISGAS